MMPGAPHAARLAAFARALPRIAKRAILLALDTAAAPLAAILAGLLASGASPPPLVLGLAALPAAALAGTDRLKLDGYEATGAARSLALALALAAFALALGAEPAAAALFALVHLALAAGGRRALLALYLHLLREGRPVEAAVIVGADAGGLHLVRALGRDRLLRPVAFLDDSPALAGIVVAGLPVRPLSDLPDVVRRARVARAFAAPDLPIARRDAAARALAPFGLALEPIPFLAPAAPRPAPLPDPAGVLGRNGCQDALAPGVAWSGRRILVTGAGGSIGGEIARQLLAARPAALVLLDASEYALWRIARDLAAAGAPAPRAVLGSVTDAPLLDRLMRDHGIDSVIHAAALKHVCLVEDNPLPAIATNVFGTRTVLDAARRAGADRVVHISTDKAVRPVGVMGATKRLAEQVALDAARRPGAPSVAVIRFGNVLGSSGSVLEVWRDEIAAGGPLTLTDPAATRYLMTSAEAARLVLAAGAMAAGGEVLALDMGEPVALLDLARRYAALHGLALADPGTAPDAGSAGPAPGRLALRLTGLRPGEKRHEELADDGPLRPTAHPKILRATAAPPAELALAAALRDLRAALDDGDPDAGRAAILRWATAGPGVCLRAAE